MGVTSKYSGMVVGEGLQDCEQDCESIHLGIWYRDQDTEARAGEASFHDCCIEPISEIQERLTSKVLYWNMHCMEEVRLPKSDAF